MKSDLSLALVLSLVGCGSGHVAQTGRLKSVASSTPASTLAASDLSKDLASDSTLGKSMGGVGRGDEIDGTRLAALVQTGALGRPSLRLAAKGL